MALLGPQAKHEEARPHNETRDSLRPKTLTPRKYVPLLAASPGRQSGPTPSTRGNLTAPSTQVALLDPGALPRIINPGRELLGSLSMASFGRSPGQCGPWV